MNTTKESTQEETEVSSEQEIETKERKLLSPKAGTKNEHNKGINTRRNRSE